jgi:hypothetical protein
VAETKLNRSRNVPEEPPSITPEQRHRSIAEAAYYRAQQRGFANGNPIDDWLHAEREVNSTLPNATKPIQELSVASTPNRRYPIKVPNNTLT